MLSDSCQGRPGARRPAAVLPASAHATFAAGLHVVAHAHGYPHGGIQTLYLRPSDRPLISSRCPPFWIAGGFFLPWLTFTGISAGYSLIPAVAVAFFCHVAAGSGLPQMRVGARGSGCAWALL